MSSFLLRASLDDPFDVKPEDLTTEREMLDSLVAFVKVNKLRVGSPDFTVSRFYAPQWGIIGNKYFWKAPGKSGKIIAVFNSKTKQYWYRESGFRMVI